MRRRLAVASVAALAITGLAACGSDSASESEGTESALVSSVSGLTVSGEFGEEPEVEVDGMDVDDVEATLVIEGEGEVLEADGAAMTSIFLANGSNGEKLQSSFNQEPFKMVVSEIDTEISEAVTGQRIGSRIALAAPASTLYGEQGTTQLGLEADDDVVLVVDLVEEAAPPVPPLDGPEGEEVEPPADAPKPVVEDGAVTALDFSDAPGAPPKELEVITLVEGEGAEVQASDEITADYFGAVWGSEEPFDDSYSRGEPLSLPLSNLVQGWAQGLEGVTVGSRVLLVIPPELGYGDQAQEKIPANSTLVFVVDVLGVG
jgi:peptidylprolyl isomerase